MKLLINGAGHEVGRSCIELVTDSHRFLFDCGIKISHDGNIYPLLKKPSTVDAVFVSHAHLDHSGALPYFNYKGLNCPIYMTPLTKEIVRLLLKDSLHVEKIRGFKPHHDSENVRNVLGMTHTVEYGQAMSFDGVAFSFFDAGHIPGSSSVFMHIEDTSILYSGDTKLNDTLLLHGADTALPAIDVLIIESTYGHKSQKNRVSERARFLKACSDVLNKGGSVVVPAFSIQRSQAVAMILLDLDFDGPIYLDGMGRKALQKYLEFNEFVRDPILLQKARNRLKLVTSKSRSFVLSQQCIVISSAGMMDGGPVLEYAEKVYSSKKNGIFLTGFQACGSNGHLLLEEGKLRLPDGVVDVRAAVEKFEFSAHSSMDELHKFILLLKPKVVVTVHGDPEGCMALKEWCESKGITAYAPVTGGEVQI